MKKMVFAIIVGLVVLVAAGFVEFQVWSHRERHKEGLAVEAGAAVEAVEAVYLDCDDSTAGFDVLVRSSQNEIQALQRLAATSNEKDYGDWLYLQLSSVLRAHSLQGDGGAQRTNCATSAVNFRRDAMAKLAGFQQ